MALILQTRNEEQIHAIAIGSEIALVCLLAYESQINNAINAIGSSNSFMAPSYSFFALTRYMQRSPNTDPISRQTIREKGWIECNFAY